MNKKSLSVTVIILIVLAIIIAVVMILMPKARLLSFAVENRQFIVTGSNLNRVELWGVPTGTDTEESDDALIDLMSPLTEEDKSNQRWFSPLTPVPLLVTNIYVKAFDKNGNEVGTLSLPYQGVSEIYNALWATSSAATSTAATSTLE